MKIKTFILTFLLMSCPFLFGQSHWIDPNLGGQESMTICATIDLDGNIQTEDYEVAVFHNQTLLEVGEIILAPNNTLYHVDLNVVGDNSMKNIYFKFFDRTNENEYVSLTKVDFNANGIGLHTAPLAIKFKSVAKIGDVVYSTLQDAVNACTTGDNTITLLDNVSDDVTIKQVENVNVLINGNDKQYSGTFTIHGNSRYEGAETLTFTNINFVTSEASHYFIDSNSTESDKRYAHNVTVDKCTFTATATSAAVNSAAAMRIRQGFDIAINESTFNGLHSALQAYGNKGITVTDITLDGKNGISAGTSSDVTISRSTINATGYGVRADANADVTTEIEIKNTNIEAFIPVVVRNASKKSNITFENNTFVGNNSDGLLCAIGITEYEENGSLPTTTTGKVIVNTTNYNGVYGNTVAQVQYSDNSVKYFTNINTAVPNSGQTGLEGATITLLSNCEGKGLRFWKNNMTFDLGGKTFTINAATGSSGSETSGFQIRPEVTEATTIQNGTIAVKTGTPVVWMFNNYAKQFNLKNVTVDCANMDWSWGNQVYALVSHKNNNGNTKFENVELINFNTNNGNPYYLENSTSLTAPEGLTSTIDTDNGAVVTYENGTYSAASAVAQVGDKTFSSVAYAIKAAQAGQTITLLKDVNENVTISKSLTFNGNNLNSKGLFTITNGNVTFKNFKIEGNSNYFVKVNGGGDNHVFEDCTVTNSQGLVNVAKSTNSIVVKNVTIEKCTYGARLVSFNDATFENVTIDDVTRRGVDIQNQGDRNVTFINCKNYAEKPVQVQSNNSTTGTVTFNFKGTNDFSINESTYSEYAELILVDNESSLKDKEGLNVTTTFNGYSVKYIDGAYKLVPNVARIGDVTFASIQEAINAAQNGNTIVVLQDVTLAYEDAKQLCNGTYKSFFNVDGKNITIDLNGKTIKAEMGAELEANAVYGLVTTENNANLTIKDSSNEKTGTMWIDNVVEVYSLIMQYDGSTITIDGGNYKLNVGGNGRGMVYANDDEKVTVNGGNFHLGNVGELQNGSPWIFNTSGQNSKNVNVYGGTYNANVFNQHYIFEVQSSREYAIKDNSNGTWTIGPSVAWVDNQEKSCNWYTYDIGYATLEEAFAAAAKCNREDYVETVTMLQDITLENTITVNVGEEVVLDLNGKVISGTCNAGQSHMIMVQNTADLTIKDSSNPSTGKLTYAQGTSNIGWAIDLEGNLTLESGTIELTGNSWSIGYAVDVRPNSWGSEYTEGTTFTMNGGKLVSSDAAIRVASSSADNHENVSASFVMNGGEIEAAWDGIFVQQSNAAYDILNVELNGGKITTPYSPFRLYGPVATSVLNNVENPITFNITGGTFDYTGNDLANAKWLVPGVMMVSGGATFDEMLEYADFVITGGTFDGDVNAYCAENFAAIANNDGTWTVKPTQKQHLVKGWNWYSSYLDIETDNLTDAIGTNGLGIKGQTTADGSKIFDNSWGIWTGTLVYNNAKMYMINTTQACELDLSANIVNPQDYTITLNTGWNWIGYPSNQSVEINAALANIPTPQEGDIIKTRNSGHAEYAWGMWVGTLKSMIPGEGYMYRNTSGEAKTFKYNVTNTRGTAEANMTSENNYWTPNVAEYPYNMTMTAILDGENNGNFEIAAFVNGEVRGSARPIYVEQLDSYMFFLTVNGNNVEEMTFKCYDLTTGEEFDLINRMNYSNDAIVGSVNEPYLLSRGTVGLEEVSSFNIYPNPTTTDREINLSTTCDKVEVFNALGVKVAEYQNVDTIDAFETAGIYVIRVTNNGNVKHCRLVVK